MLKLLAALLLSLYATTLSAHPHAWIDVRSTFILNEDGSLAKIEEEWVFDELYTASILDGLANDNPGKADVVSSFAAEVMANLYPYNYFMQLSVGDEFVPMQEAVHYKSELHNDVLKLSFTAVPSKTLNPAKQTLTLSVFDPSYFIQMMHREDEPPSLQGPNPANCIARIEAPNPTPEMIARAYALDYTAQPDEDIGDLFAEKVHIQCS